MEQQAGGGAERPAGQSVSEKVGQPAEQPTEQPAEQPTKQPAEQKTSGKAERQYLTEEEIAKSKEITQKVNAYYRERIVGQENLRQALMVALIANGHILLESVPGLAKTTAAKTLAQAMNGKFSRIQCTPDLLPSDIVGTQIFNYATNSFETKIGPIYANFVLLDEINRSSSKTQSATLEAMQERCVTLDGKNYKLPEIFIVIATQNPIEQEGTYLLAEAQLDRFLLKEKINYPSANEEIEILNRIEKNVFAKEEAILSLQDLKFLQELAQRVYVDEAVKKYITQIIAATRIAKKVIDQKLAEYIDYGASTRGAIAFMEGAKALALLCGRDHAVPDDVKALRYSVLRHRISLNFSAVADGVSVEQIIDAIFAAVAAP